MIIKAGTSRNRTYVQDVIEETNFSRDPYIEEERYCFYGHIELLDEYTEECMLTFDGTFFDETAIMNNGESLIEVSDMIDSDTNMGISYLVSRSSYEKEYLGDKLYLPLFSVYISRLYVNPKHRGQGLAKYLLSNFEAICKHCFNVYLHAAVTCPKPQEPNNQDEWINTIDTDGAILKRIESVIKADGFKKIRASEYFYKVYSE